jgi:uncharacterized membrane protein
LLATAAIFDLIYLVWGNATMIVVSYWMIVAGMIGGLVAAPFGLIDYLAIPSGTRAKSIGLIHGVGYVIVLLLFAGSWWLRYGAATSGNGDIHLPTTLALALSFAGFALAGVTGWLGGELVDWLGMGVDDGAHLDAPNSILTSDARKRSA